MQLTGGLPDFRDGNAEGSDSRSYEMGRKCYVHIPPVLPYIHIQNQVTDAFAVSKFGVVGVLRNGDLPATS